MVQHPPLLVENRSVSIFHQHVTDFFYLTCFSFFFLSNNPQSGEKVIKLNYSELD